MRFAVLFLTLALPCASFSQQTATPIKPPIAVYTDTELHFTYTYDSALKGETDPAKPAPPNCNTTPIAAFDATVGLRLLAVFKTDFACRGQKPDALALVLLTSAHLNDVLERFGKPTTNLGTPYMLGEHHNAQAATGSVVAKKVKLNGKPVTFHGVSSCAIIGGDIVCWVFTSADCKDFDSMMAYPIRFDGEEAMPLIPPSTIKTCQP